MDFIKKIEYDLYLVLLGVLALLSYSGNLGVLLMPIYSIIALVLIFKKKSVLYFLPIALFLHMGFADLRDNVELTTMHTIVFVVLLVIDTLVNRKITKLGKLFVPLAILTAISIISIINAPTLFSGFAGFTQMASALLLYFYYVNTTDNKEDNFIKVSKMFLYLGVFVTIEMLYFISMSDVEVITLIQRRMINLGWENMNIVIYNSIIGVPFAGYLIMKSKVKEPYMILALISVLGIFLTLSRSSILSVALMLVLMVPVMFYYEKNKKSLIMQGVGFVVLFTITLFMLEQKQLISGYIDSLMGRDLLHYDDRYVLLEVAWQKFKEFPLFGSGGLYTSRHYLNGPLNYHNTLAQISTLGITGIIAFVYLFVEKTKLLFSKKHEIKWFLIIMIFVTTFINGSLQPMYFYTPFLGVLFMLLALYENVDEGLNEDDK